MASPPPIPSSNDQGPRFLPQFESCERGELYQPGKFHPVDLGDTFLDGKYKVIRKLGHGCSSTVWLAVSSGRPKYVVLKVLRADVAPETMETAVMEHLLTVGREDPGLQYIRKHLDSFIHSGPNGDHQCYVSEVMGASADSMKRDMIENQGEDKPRLPVWMAKKLLLHGLRALAFMHRHGVVQADFQPGNLLFELESLEGLDEEELKQDVSGTKWDAFNTPIPLERIDGKVDLWAPKTLYYGQSLHDRVPRNDLRVKLSDFGGAYFESKPPTDFHVPFGLRAPELILERPITNSIDIWSFGYLIYEFLTNDILFLLFLYGTTEFENDRHLCMLNDTIQRLPEDMMRDWPRAGDWFNADHTYVEREIAHTPGKTLEVRFAELKHPDIGDEEAAVICQLLRKILVYDPAERPSAEELLKHPWLSE